VERAIFLTVLHRLFVSGSDRSCDRWHRDLLAAEKRMPEMARVVLLA
jgi:hypothetical protein